MSTCKQMVAKQKRILLLCDMDISTVKRTLVSKTAERQFILSGHRVWACSLLAGDSHEFIGVRLKVVLPFGSSVRTYLTSDGGQSFQHVANFFGLSAAEDLIEDSETETSILAILKQAFEVWQRASGHNEQRLVIRSRCVGLRKLFVSLAHADTASQLQTVAHIESNCQTVPDERLSEVTEELSDLLKILRNTDSGDGEAILNPVRYKEFLTEPQS
jgi:hypothetical protein